MKRRDRILNAINHKPVDKIPISFDIFGEAEKGVLKYFGAKDLVDLYQKSGVEAFSVWTWPSAQPKYVGPPRPFVTEYDASMAYGCWGKVSEKHYPLEHTSLNEYMFPKVEDFDFSNLKRDLQTIKQMDMTTASGHAGCGWLHHVQMSSYNEVFYQIMDDEFMTDYMALNEEFFVNYFKKLFKYADGKIDIIRADEDLGGQSSLLISPELWRKWYKPLWKKVFNICKENGAKIWLHSCGYCYPLINDFIELGVDILNPLPPYVKDSDPQEMKREFGKKLAFDGGVDQINVIMNGTPEDVVRETKLRLDQLSPGSGYLAGPSQVFMSDTPVENIIAFIKTVLDYKV